MSKLCLDRSVADHSVNVKLQERGSVYVGNVIDVELLLLKNIIFLNKCKSSIKKIREKQTKGLPYSLRLFNENDNPF